MQVRVPNAMTEHALARPKGASVPFPVALEAEPLPGGLEGTALYPVALNEVLDLVVPHMLPFTMLTAVDTYEVNGPDPLPLAESCRRHGVDVRHEDSDNVIIDTPDLLTLFGELQTYNLKGLDLASPADDLAAAWCSVWDGPLPVLPRAPESTVFLSSHDDAFVWIEARGAGLRLELGRRLLAMLIGTHLLDAPGTVDVIEPALPDVELVLGDALAFSCAQGGIRRENQRVEVPFVRAYRGPPDVLEPTHLLTYDGSVGTWTVAEIG